MGVRYTIVLLKSVIKECVEDFIKHAIRVGSQFSCHEGDCELHNQTYIGLATTTLSRRLTMHLSNGGPKQHTQNSHNINLTSESLANNTKIICTNNDPYRLSILEAMYIRKLSPSIEKQIASSHLSLKLWVL